MSKKNNERINSHANLIWSLADTLTGIYKPHEYGLVILPLVVIKRFDSILKDTHKAVLDKASTSSLKGEMLESVLKKASGHQFFNTSKFTFDTLLDDAPNIKENFIDYLDNFSFDVKDILKNYSFNNQIDKMSDPANDILFPVLSKMKEVDLHPNKVSNIEMGYIFEEIIRRFSESHNEEAGQHYTPREVIQLMVSLLLSEDSDLLSGNAKIKTIYDPACGTGGMLSEAQEYLNEMNSNVTLKVYGQEINEETYAIAKSDLLIKGQDASSIKRGNTLQVPGTKLLTSIDGFIGNTFDYIISNPPFGREWKKEADSVLEEMKLGHGGRFGAFSGGKPDISDGQTLFQALSLAKMKDYDPNNIEEKPGSKIAIIHNGSPLFTGDVGNGVNLYRKYLLENDLLEAIIQLPNDIFYNTGITVYIWIVTNRKPLIKKGKVHLIDASSELFYEKMKKNLGKKRVEITTDQINEIVKLYCEFKETEHSKIFDNRDFGYTQITIQQPLMDGDNIVKDKKGKPVPDSSKKDVENVPLKENIEEYFKREVLAYSPNAWYELNTKKETVGYEIPFTRHFYKFIPPRNSDEIFNEIKQLEREEKLLMKELFGDEV